MGEKRGGSGSVEGGGEVVIVVRCGGGWRGRGRREIL